MTTVGGTSDHCEMLLYAPNHKCIASCTSDRSGRHEIKRREEELQLLPSLTLSSTSRTLLSFLRIVLLVAFALCALEHHPFRIYLYWAAFLFDVLSREGRHADGESLQHRDGVPLSASNDALPDGAEPQSPTTAASPRASTQSSSPSTSPLSSSWPLLRALNCYGDDINIFFLYTAAIMFDAASSSSPRAVWTAEADASLSSLSSLSLASSIFTLFHTQSTDASSTGGIAWFRLVLILCALLEFTAITASTDQLHWRRDEDQLYHWLRTALHPALVTAIGLGSEVYLVAYAPVSYASAAAVPFWPWLLVASCFLLRQVSVAAADVSFALVSPATATRGHRSVCRRQTTSRSCSRVCQAPHAHQRRPTTGESSGQHRLSYSHCNAR